MKTYKLMIKTAINTGMKYLCITSKSGKLYDSYKGSGKFWKYHIEKHESKIKTELLFESDDIELFGLVCFEYSKQFDIVKSLEWANLIPELGWDNNCLNFKSWYDQLEGESKINFIKKRNKSISRNHWIYNDKNKIETICKLKKAIKQFYSTLSVEDKFNRTKLCREGRTKWYNNLSDEELFKIKEKLSLNFKKYFSNIKLNPKLYSEYCDKISIGRLNTSPEVKQRRKEKIQEVYLSGKHDNLSKRWSEERRGGNNPMSRQVSINGTIYESITDAAKTLLISKHILSNRVRSTLEKYNDYFYTTENEKHNYRNNCEVRVSILGKIYSSIVDAQKELLISKNILRHRINSSLEKYNDYFYVDKQYSKKPKTGRRVSIENIEYLSIGDASEKLGIPNSTIKNRILSTNFKNYYYIDLEKISSNAKQVSVNGVVYISLIDASIKLGITKHTLIKRINSKLEDFKKYFYLTKGESDDKVEINSN